jgi:hypothetical protein
VSSAKLGSLLKVHAIVITNAHRAVTVVMMK